MRPNVLPSDADPQPADETGQPASPADAAASDGGSGDGRPELTPRQLEVLRLLAEGLSMKEAGRNLNIAPRTVAFHKYQMMAQLKITSSAGLVQYAVRQGIV